MRRSAAGRDSGAPGRAAADLSLGVPRSVKIFMSWSEFQLRCSTLLPRRRRVRGRAISGPGGSPRSTPRPRIFPLRTGRGMRPPSPGSS